MPKIKTNRGAAKRVKLTKKGKIKRAQAGAAHILTKKSSKRKKKLRQGALVHASQERTIKRMLGKA